MTKTYGKIKEIEKKREGKEGKVKKKDKERKL